MTTTAYLTHIPYTLKCAVKNVWIFYSCGDGQDGHPTDTASWYPMVRTPIMGDDDDPKKTCLDCRNHPGTMA